MTVSLSAFFQRTKTSEQVLRRPVHPQCGRLQCPVCLCVGSPVPCKYIINGQVTDVSTHDVRSVALLQESATGKTSNVTV